MARASAGPAAVAMFHRSEGREVALWDLPGAEDFRLIARETAAVVVCGSVQEDDTVLIEGTDLKVPVLAGLMTMADVEASLLVQAYWGAVAAVADGLIAKGRMSAAEVRAVVAGCRRRNALDAAGGGAGP